MKQAYAKDAPPRLLVIQTAGPDSVAAREALDVVLNAAALDIPVQLVLQGEAILNLVKQSSQAVVDTFATPSIQKKYGMLALLDVPPPLVASEDLSQLALTTDRLSQTITVLPRHEIHQQHAQFTQLLRF